MVIMNAKEYKRLKRKKKILMLTWFCNICEKQCRDYRSFMIHLTTDAHKREVELSYERIARLNAFLSESWLSP